MIDEVARRKVTTLREMAALQSVLTERLSLCVSELKEFKDCMQHLWETENGKPFPSRKDLSDR